MTNPEHLKSNKDSPERELPPAERPRIYVASLADYNAGRLHGEWLDATEPIEQIHERIQAMLAKSKELAPEEFAVQDYENFGSVRIGEYDTIEHISRIAQGIAEHGSAFDAWVTLTDDEDMWDSFSDSYLGRFDSLTDYAERLAEDLGYLDALDQAVPDFLKPFIRFDAEQFARDLRYSGSVSTIESNDNGVWVFDTNL